MCEAVNFFGEQGVYRFDRVSADGDWARVPGITIFAALEGAAWRVIRISEQAGVTDDVGAFWRWREARRHGAAAIFLRRQPDVVERRAEARDLREALDPVYGDIELPVAA